MSTTTIQPIDIQPNQVQHYYKVLDILKRFYFYIDGSETGTGKTYIASAVAVTLGLPCIVICPKGARNTWRQVFLNHGITTYHITKHLGIITYETLRSRKGKQPKHGLLVRDDSGSHPKFYPTELWSNIIRNNVFLIFDEAQKLKNDSDQHKASSALIQQFYTLTSGIYGTVTTTPAPQIKSRFALLSASLVDKPIQVINLLEMVGFIQYGGTLGVQDILNKASQIDPIATNQFIASTPLGSGAQGVIEYSYKLFVQVIRPAVMSTITKAPTTAIKDVRNGYYELTPQDQVLYNQAIGSLIKALKLRSRRGQLHEALKLIVDPDDPSRAVIQTELKETKGKDLGEITTSLILIQRAKMNAMIRVARQILSLKFTYQGSVITPKLILFADYYQVIDYLLQNLREYNPVELTGRISEDQRNANIAAFQQPNDQTRLLIGNPVVGGLSVNLHDTTGLFPRFMFVMPGHRVNELVQASGRIFRFKTKGVAIVRFFYGKSNMRESSVLDIMARKGETLEEVHAEQGVVFPNDYPEEDESQLIPDFMNLFLESMKVPQPQVTDLTEALSSLNINK